MPMSCIKSDQSTEGKKIKISSIYCYTHVNKVLYKFRPISFSRMVCFHRCWHDCTEIGQPASLLKAAVLLGVALQQLHVRLVTECSISSWVGCLQKQTVLSPWRLLVNSEIEQSSTGNNANWRQNIFSLRKCAFPQFLSVNNLSKGPFIYSATVPNRGESSKESNHTKMSKSEKSGDRTV